MASPDVETLLRRLTPTELTVLRLRCQGLEWPEIAEKLVVAERTVYFHVANIYDKLNIATLTSRRKRDIALRQIFCSALANMPPSPAPSPSRDTEPPEPDEDILALVLYDALAPAVIDRGSTLLSQSGSPKQREEEENVIHVRMPERGKQGLLGPPKPSVSRQYGNFLWGGLGVIVGLLVALAGLSRFATATPTMSLAAPPPPSIQASVIAMPTVEVTRVVQVVVTATPAPTATRTPGPTPTPVPSVTPSPPTATPDPNTRPGTVLQFGQQWYQDGVGMTLSQPIWRDPQVAPYCGGLLSFRLAIVNETNSDLLVNASSADWYAIDSRGTRYPIKLGIPLYGCQDWSTNLLRAGQTTTPYDSWAGEMLLVVQGDFQNASAVQWLRVVVPQLSRIKNATWQIDVAH